MEAMNEPHCMVRSVDATMMIGQWWTLAVWLHPHESPPHPIHKFQARSGSPVPAASKGKGACKHCTVRSVVAARMIDRWQEESGPLRESTLPIVLQTRDGWSSSRLDRSNEGEHSTARSAATVMMVRH